MWVYYLQAYKFDLFSPNCVSEFVKPLSYLLGFFLRKIYDFLKNHIVNEAIFFDENCVAYVETRPGVESSIVTALMANMGGAVLDTPRRSGWFFSS